MEIAKRIKIMQDKNQHVYPLLYVEYHKKFSIPLACLIFVIVGMPLGITFHRSGKGVSFGLAFIILFVYFIFLQLGEILGNKEIISPSLSMWVPNIILFITGAYIFFLRAKE